MSFGYWTRIGYKPLGGLNPEPPGAEMKPTKQPIVDLDEVNQRNHNMGIPIPPIQPAPSVLEIKEPEYWCPHCHSTHILRHYSNYKRGVDLIICLDCGKHSDPEDSYKPSSPEPEVTEPYCRRLETD